MAAGLAVGALGPVIEVLKLVTKPIIRQFNYLCCFTSNIDSLKDEAKNLDDALAGLDGEVERARDNVQEPVPQVQAWLTDSKKIQDEISGILDEAENVGSGCSNLRARFSLSKRAKKITDRTKELRGKGNFEVKFQQGPPAARQAVQFGKTFECESRNKIEDDIMTTLRGGNVNMVGICGMGGLGKTTMAQKIRNRVLNEDVFQEVAMAVVSQPVDKSKIQVEIGGSLGLHLKDDTSETRVQKLHARLSDTKRSTLLVLDDVWERLVLEEFGIPRDSKWCTVLFTSRNSDVLRAMDVQIFGMKVLSEEEAWSFFRERAGVCVDDTELNPIAKQVAKECGGLPLALEVVGVGLKHQRSAAIWKNTLRELKQRVPDTVRFDKEVYNPLRWSYNRLNSKAAQSIFLLCCFFPEDADIPLEYLTYFCMGLHIFDGITNMEDASNKMCAETEKLKDRSLLLESDKKDCVRMHDVIRDVCIIIAKEEGYSGKNGCIWISSSDLVGERKELLSGSRRPNLHLLLLNNKFDSSGFQFDDAFLEGMRELYVLGIKNNSLTMLAHLTQSLRNLNTLILDSCWGSKTISAVGELVNLEILICRRCQFIRELPAEMKGLNRLKVLELTGCINLQSIGRGIIRSLVRLEELKMLGSFKRWEAEEREERVNVSIKELEDLTNLACLEIDIEDPSLLLENMPLLSKKIVRFIIVISNVYLEDIPPEFSKVMRLRLERESRLGDWIEMQFLRDTECLELGGGGASNVDLAKIQHNIRWLQLRSCENMKNLVTASDDHNGDAAIVLFPSIEHLSLYRLPELQDICDGPISLTSFQNLKNLKLKDLSALMQIWKSRSVCENNNNVPHFTNLSSIDIGYCDSLRNLGQLSMAAGKDCLPQLERLHIRHCSMMEQVFLWNDEEEAAGKNKNSILITKVFPILKEVVLVSLPNLTTFYQGIQGIEFPLLQKMRIEECPKMKSMIDGSNSAHIDHEDGSLHLLCQPQKISYGSLESLHIRYSNPFCGHEIPSSVLKGLEKLIISEYEGSMLFTLPVAANLVSLRILWILNCKKMIKVIEDEQQQQRNILVFPKLQILELTYLPKLVSFCISKCEVELPLLRNVRIIKCPSMESLSLGSVATPNLEAFKTDLSTYVGVGVDVAFTSLKELKIKESENPFDHHKISVSLFKGLKWLIFSYYDYKGSVSLISSSAIGTLVNLTTLEIKFCGEIVKVFEDEEEEDDEKVVLSGGEIKNTVVFPKLENLYLAWLPKLVRFCEWKCDVELPSLTKLEIWRCPNIENFSMGFVAAPNLKIVRIDMEEIDTTEDLNGLLQQHYLARQQKENERRRSSQEKDEIEEEDDDDN